MPPALDTYNTCLTYGIRKHSSPTVLKIRSSALRVVAVHLKKFVFPIFPPLETFFSYSTHNKASFKQKKKIDFFQNSRVALPLNERSAASEMISRARLCMHAKIVRRACLIRRKLRQFPAPIVARSSGFREWFLLAWLLVRLVMERGNGWTRVVSGKHEYLL